MTAAASAVERRDSALHQITALSPANFLSNQTIDLTSNYVLVFLRFGRAIDVTQPFVTHSAIFCDLTL